MDTSWLLKTDYSNASFKHYCESEDNSHVKEALYD